MAFGSTYVNDFMYDGRVQRVIVQAEAHRPPAAGRPGQAGVRNTQRRHGAVFVVRHVAVDHGFAAQLERYNGHAGREAWPARPRRAAVHGRGHAEMEQLDGPSCRRASASSGPASRYEEKRLAGPQAPMLYALSLLIVFLCLAALYESWSIPVAVMLVVPLGVLGALLGRALCGMPNDVYFKVGLIATIGLSAKNAHPDRGIRQGSGGPGPRGLVEATLEAVQLAPPADPDDLAWPSSWAWCRWSIATGAGSGSQARHRHRA